MSMGQVIIGVAAPWAKVALPRMTSHARYVRVRRTFDEVLSTTRERQDSSALPLEQPASTAPYQVKRGDTLSGIVRNHLLDMGLPVTRQSVHQGVLDAARANQLRNPNMLHPGQKLDLSSLNTRRPTTISELTPVSAPNPPETVAAPKILSSVPPSPDSKDPIAPAPPQGGSLTEDVVTVPVVPMPPQPGESSAKQELSRMIEELVARRNKPKSTPKESPPWAHTLGGPGWLSSKYGIRRDPFSGRMAFHNGIDIAAKKGTPIHPYQSGEVVFSGTKSGYGNVVIVRHDNGLESVYGHTAGNLVKKGDRVTPDTLLAKVGSTGRSTGPHLHFEIRKNNKAVNPMTYLQSQNLKLARNP